MTMSLPEVHLVGGTCAEAVRLAPVVTAMRTQRRLTPVLLAGGADPAAVARTFAAFGRAADVTLPAAADRADAVRELDQFWAVRTPSAVVVRGDNLAAALAAHWRRIPIMHLDAGRRSGALAPADDAGETEANRRLLAQIATVHLAATPQAAMNLLDERVVAGDVLLTGGTAVDAAHALAGRSGPGTARTRPLIMVGMGPRHDDPVGAAVRRLGADRPDVDVVTAAALPYPERTRLLTEAYLVLTDDVDFAEEALAAGIPVLVPGDGSGLGEALHAGSARLVEPVSGAVFAAVTALLESRVRRQALATAGTPYGDGLAARRVAQATAALLGHGQFPDPMPARPLITTR
jgi:UDP-N-acetylglucosamine 2-epimerase (non-hydrolysing)